MVEAGLVSIICPIYKVSNVYLVECIESLIKQTYEALEIILILDGAEPELQKICKDYTQKDKRVISVYQENKGVSEARNKGITMSQGEFLMFVDSDDFIKKTMVENLVRKMKESTADIIQSDAIRYFGKTEREIYGSKGIYELNELARNKEDLIANLIYPKLKGERENLDLGYVWGKLYRTNLIKENKIFFENGMKYLEDNIFALYAFEAAKKIIFVDEAYYYRDSESSISKKVSDNFVIWNAEMLSKTREFCDSFPKMQKWDKALEEKLLYICKHLVLTVCLNGEIWNEELGFLKKSIKQFKQSSGVKKIYIDKNSSRKEKVIEWLIIKKAYFILNLIYTNTYWRIYRGN